MSIFGIPFYLDFTTFVDLIQNAGILGIDTNFLFIGWLLFTIIYFIFWITILKFVYKVVLYVLKIF